MCGKTEAAVKAEIEGTEMKVCNECALFGKRLAAPVQPKVFKTPPKRKAIQREQLVELVADDFAERVKGARERMGLKQEEFAKQIQEKESVVHNIESGKYRPALDLARKLERFLKISLVERYEEKREVKAKPSGEGLTIGDLMEIK
jgi:putative transcription factor